jgi:hypothetical protein
VDIERKSITVRELVEGYTDNGEGGVKGFEGQLDIRPPYQREFIYKDKQRDAVITTASKNFPLNVMYWAVQADGGFEVIDGQQRTISLCQYVEGEFALSVFGKPEVRYFHNLQQDEKDRLLDYELMIYQCAGSDSEKLEWFKTINIAGEPLTAQELRNAVYHGPWVSAAKPYFSKTNCPAYQQAHDLMSGSPIRQDYLETAIEWLNAGDVEGYMAAHQNDPNANELWLYFKKVVEWVRTVFPTYRREMKGLSWGSFYNRFGETALDTAAIEARVDELMVDDEIDNKRGIYEYVLDGEERHLNLRAFNDKQKREAYERQKGICVKCGEHFEFEGMEGDHITPWHEGGKTIASNCQMLCIFDNRSKGSK